IFGRDVRADLDAGARIQEPLEPFARADAHVMAALRADVQIALQLRAIQDRVAGRALDPQAFGDRVRTTLRLDARRHDFFEPGHPLQPVYAKGGRMIADRKPSIAGRLRKPEATAGRE